MRVHPIHTTWVQHLHTRTGDKGEDGVSDTPDNKRPANRGKSHTIQAAVGQIQHITVVRTHVPAPRLYTPHMDTARSARCLWNDRARGDHDSGLLLEKTRVMHCHTLFGTHIASYHMSRCAHAIHHHAAATVVFRVSFLFSGVECVQLTRVPGEKGEATPLSTW